MYQVIFIDDEPWTLYGLEDIVDWEGLGFEKAGAFLDGREAWEAVQNGLAPDVILTDIQMPEFSGTELIDRIRREGIEAELVIISAYRDFEVARNAIRQGVAEYLTKPLKEEEVRQVMEKIRGKLEKRKKVPLTVLEEGPSGSDSQGGVLEEYLERAASYPECYVLLSKDGFEKEMKGLPGKLTCVQVKGFRESYLYSALRPMEQPLISGKASRSHRDFKEVGRMIQEARLALEGDFSYAAQEQTASIQYYLANHYQERISMSELANQFHLSESYLFELFRRYAGTTVMNFIRDIRLYHAIWYLGNTRMSIKEIAEKVGYDDPGYFSRLFKKRFTISPESCRKI